jgi:hypothetical protein
MLWSPLSSDFRRSRQPQRLNHTPFSTGLRDVSGSEGRLRCRPCCAWGGGGAGGGAVGAVPGRPCRARAHRRRAGGALAPRLRPHAIVEVQGAAGARDGDLGRIVSRAEAEPGAGRQPSIDTGGGRSAHLRGASSAASRSGGGESFLRVHWVAVPKELRARRINRRRRRRRRLGNRQALAWPRAAAAAAAPRRHR